MTGEITVTTIVIGLKTVTLVLGGLITYLAVKAYRRTGEQSLGLLAVGFAVATSGTFLAGVVDQVFGGFQMGLLVESALVAVGFLVIVYSLYATAD